ncbi:MAG TPA: UPF0179 family protein [Nitrososphaerales archaeon]
MNPKIYSTVSRYVARNGYSFKFLGSNDICKSCKTMKTCLGRLEDGEQYSVISVGKNRVKCILLEEESVVVQLQLSNRILAVNNKSAVIGTIVKLNEGGGEACGAECKCFPTNVKPNRKYMIKRIIQKVFDCPLGSRSIVEVEPV